MHTSLTSRPRIAKVVATAATIGLTLIPFAAMAAISANDLGIQYGTATGLGTTVRHKNGSLSAAGSFEAGNWHVVISRLFSVRGDGVAVLRLGQTGKVGFAVWQGSNQERAGIKAVTLDWQPLEIQE